VLGRRDWYPWSWEPALTLVRGKVADSGSRGGGGEEGEGRSGSWGRGGWGGEMEERRIGWRGQRVRGLDAAAAAAAAAAWRTVVAVAR
jgi:hypothetical protein